MAGPHSLTSFDAAGLVTSADLPAPTLVTETAPAPPARAGVVRESNGVWGGTLDLGTFISAPGLGLFGGDTSLDGRYGGWWPADRVQLPNHAPTGILTEPQWRALLTWSRWLCERNMLAIGFWDQVANFVGNCTVGWVKRGDDPGAVADGGADDDPLVKEVTAFWDEWCQVAGWGVGMEDRQRECRRRLLRDGEVILRLGHGGPGSDWLPWVRFVEPEQVRFPTGGLSGLTDGDWSWGVCTAHGDAETVLSYWVAHPDSGGAVGQEVDPAHVIHQKDNVDRTIKRGFPSFTPADANLQNTLGLLGNLGTTGKAQSAIAWIEQYATATPDQVRDLLARGATYEARFPPGVPHAGGGGVPVTPPGFGRPLPVRHNPAGTVIGADQNRQYTPGPTSEGVPYYLQIVDATLKAVGWRFGIPDWFTAGAQAFAAALVTGSPFVVAIEDRQNRVKGLNHELAVRVVRLAEESGRLPAGTSRKVKPVVTAKPVVIADEQKQSAVDDMRLRNKLVDPQHLIREAGLDPKVVAANIKAWAKETGGGDQAPAGASPPPPPGASPPPPPPGGTDPTPAPPGSAGGDGSESPAPAGGSVREAAPHRFSSTLVTLEGEARERLLALGRAVPDADLADDGREEDPHVTVRYGLETDDPAAVAAILRNEGPVRLRLGRVSVFPGADSGKDFDVVKVDVESPDLVRLHRRLGALPHTDTHPEYRPHATIAYVRAGLGDRVAGWFAPLGLEATADAVVFSDRERAKTPIPLARAGGGEAVTAEAFWDRVAAGEWVTEAAAGKVAKKVQVTRNGKTFTTTVWVRGGQGDAHEQHPAAARPAPDPHRAAEEAHAALHTVATRIDAHRKDLRELDRAADDLGDRLFKLTNPGISGAAPDPKLTADLTRQKDEIVERRYQIWGQVRALRESARDTLAKALAPHIMSPAEFHHFEPGTVDYPHAEPLGRPPTPAQAGAIRAAQAFAGAVCNWDTAQRYWLVKARTGRAWASPGWAGGPPMVAVGHEWDGAARAGEPGGEAAAGRLAEVSAAAAAQTHVHELGHLIEFRKPGVRAAAQAFLKGRIKDEPPRPMRELIGPGFEAHEVGCRDDFDKAFGRNAAYAGKVYADGDTEIVSMGLEKLFEDPAGFAKADPDYFKFMVGVLTS